MKINNKGESRGNFEYSMIASRQKQHLLGVGVARVREASRKCTKMLTLVML